jgi:predicted ATPase
MRELLQHHCGITTADPPATIHAKVHQALEEVGMPPAQIAPYLLHLLDVSGEPELTARLSPQAIRARTVAALVQLALQGARRRPLVLEVENLHGIDPSSEEVLTALVERLAGSALLLLASYRPGYRLPWLDRSYAAQVALVPLNPSDSRQMIRANLRTPSAAEALVPAIVAKAEGNPFFLEELARAVGDSDAPQWRPSEVPATVQGVLAARIDRLPSTAKQLLQVAAVIGKEVPLPLLQAVASLPEERLEQQLARLQAREFLYEIFRESTPAYTFTHALTQEVAYGSLLRGRRRTLHRRIVEAIEARSPHRLVDQVERLAHHALKGRPCATAGRPGPRRPQRRRIARRWLFMSRRWKPCSISPRAARHARRLSTSASICEMRSGPTATVSDSLNTYAKPKPSPRTWTIRAVWRIYPSLWRSISGRWVRRISPSSMASAPSSWPPP